MSRSRTSAPWAATSVPDIRRHWCNALDLTITRHSEPLTSDGIGAGDRRMQRLQDKLASAVALMEAEAHALRDAQLYWVSRDMVDVVRNAAHTLPEWTPALAFPAPNGLLCWAKPAGEVPYGPKKTSTVDIPWDAVWWWLRPDGALQVTPASRFTKHQELIKPFQVSTPLWAAHTIVVHPQRRRTEEANGSEDQHPFVSALGAAWLLMAQANVAETRTLGPAGAAGGRRDRDGDDTADQPAVREPSTVTIVELRARASDRGTDQQAGGSGRTYSHRWPVEGHWRQQPCGPNNSQRKPKYITDYVKGPKGAPLIKKEKVRVLRKGR